MNDPLNFADAIQLDHLTDEQLEIVNKIFEDWK
jgi:hypothetical protein